MSVGSHISVAIFNDAQEERREFGFGLGRRICVGDRTRSVATLSF
jgi:hypothetical protein